ncbi:MAG: class I SAM-dependent methyltransferase [Synergistaceae bacterium]|nr:class I SAM-dependent methyltransferase [Synergistaceae bacterium]
MHYVDFLGNMRHEKKGVRSGFLYGTKRLKSLSTSQGENVVVLGTGENSFACTHLLKDHNIEVAAYCDNYAPLVGRTFMGKKILSPFDVFSRKNNHVLVAIDSENFDAVTDQMSHNKAENVSYFFHRNTSVDFEEPQTRELVLTALNCLINNEYDKRIHQNAPLGITFRLMPGLEWWRDVFYWLCDDLKAQDDHFKVLDIGPGFGFVSLLVKLLRPDCDLDWLCLSIEERTEKSFIDSGKKLYPVTQHYGVIEDPDFRLKQKYDVIIMTEVFEHFATAPVPTLTRITELLNKNGRIYLSTPNWEKANLYRSWKDMPPFQGDRNEYYAQNKSRIKWMDLNLKHAYLYEKPELLEIFALCNLKVERFTVNDCNNFNILLEKK